ncbi:MAG: SGNH/GDSL hydrolase family protein [Candidatus Melainabacteria bacterium]|nr:SGNH/GDSL hydrolase family protein [Candidatus Melainabacteria bacterium]
MSYKSNLSKTNAYSSLKKLYFWIASNLLALVLIFILSNIFLGALYAFRSQIVEINNRMVLKSGHFFNQNGSPVSTSKRNASTVETFDFNACKELGEKYASDLLDDFFEFGKIGLIYQPWIQFSEPPFRSKKVNVLLDERGFPIRKTINPERVNNKKTIRIFTFGGSTTFGYSVSDEHTWPSFLSRIINEKAKSLGKPVNIEVVNYGRGSYFPTQESFLLIDLLNQGHRPSLVIFLDGVNWGLNDDTAEFTPQLGKLFIKEQEHKVQGLLYTYKWLPMFRLVTSLKFHLEEYFENLRGIENSSGYEDQDISRLINRFERNRININSICSLYGIKTLFFLQPNSAYSYNLKLFRPDIVKKEFNNNKKDLDALSLFHKGMKSNSSYIDLSTLFDTFGKDNRAFVDTAHYSPRFSKLVASQIASYINLDELKVFPELIDKAKLPGDKRIPVLRNKPTSF